MRKVLENRAVQDEERMGKLEEELKMPEIRQRMLTKSMRMSRRDCSRLSQSLKGLRRELILERNLCRNSRKRLTDWRMNLLLSRRSTRPSLRSWRPLLLKCLVIKSDKCVNFKNCVELLFESHQICM